MKKVGDSWDFLGRGESPIPPTRIKSKRNIKSANAKLVLDKKFKRDSNGRPVWRPFFIKKADK